MPADPGILVGRVHDPGQGGPSVVLIRDGRALDITELSPTTADLFELPDLPALLRSVESERSWDLETLLKDTFDRSPHRPRLLAPIDLQVVKAAGVTFAKSMLERVIEERSKGDPLQAAEVRKRVTDAIGGTLASVRPGTEAAASAKRILIEEGLWSQYLEVGIGPDPEIFTKAPVLSAVGTGEQVGVLARSTWNNPEPEVVLIANSRGEAVGASLGNDVNLRDFEGRSALLLTEAKDNNASCAIGPFVRLFDETFSPEDVRALEVELAVTGDDGFELCETSSMRELSRDIDDLLGHTRGDHHSYPDGFALFTGTLFAPTQDRDQPGLGFTHHRGDIVKISTPKLGALMNEVVSSEEAPDWRFGIRALMANLAARGLIGAPA